MRKIYLTPGEQIEFRFVHPDLPRNAAEWSSQPGRPSLLLALSEHTVGYVDPKITFVNLLRDGDK